MWFEATARMANPIVDDQGDGSIFSSIGFLAGVAAGGCVLLALAAFGIHRYQSKDRGFSDTEEGGGGGCCSCLRGGNRDGVNINGKVEILGLRRVSKERPVREEIEERPFYSNLMNLIQPQQTKDQDEWNDTRWWGKGNKTHNSGLTLTGQQKNDRNQKGKGGRRGDRSYNSTPASILETPNAAATLFSCGVGENTLCRSAPTKGGRDDDSYNFTVETPFTNHTGRSSGRSSRQSSRQSSRRPSRYDDSTVADESYADNTYADDTYASRSTADSRNRRSRGKPSKSKSASRSRSRHDRYDQGTVDNNTYADDDDFSEDSSYDD